MLYNRLASLVIGQSGGKGVEIKGLRISFSIQKGATKSPNQCTVKVYNLARDTRAQVEKVGNVLILKAGYEQDFGESTIFTGNIIRVFTKKEGVDWITEIELSDGYIPFRDSKITITFNAGISVAQVIKNLSEKFGLPVRPLPSNIINKQYVNGFSFVGRVRDAISKACENAGLEWSIQNNEIQIIEKGGVFRKQAYLLSEDTGLINTPMQETKTMTDKTAAKSGVTLEQKNTKKVSTISSGKKVEKLQVTGYKANCLLLPLLEPGGYIKLKSATIDNEFFRIEELMHIGDTHGAEWQTELTLRSI